MWFNIREAAVQEAFWFSRVEHLIGRALHYGSYDSDALAWKRTFYELDSVLSPDSCPFSDLAHLFPERGDCSLAARVLLDSGRFPSNVLGTLSLACQSKKLGFLRALLQDARVRSNAPVISSLISWTINVNLESGLPFQSCVAHLFLNHPLCEPNERMMVLASICRDERGMYSILKSRRFQMSWSLRCLNFSAFLIIALHQVPDRHDGYMFAVKLTRDERIPTQSYDALLRVLIIQERTTEECIEYMMTNSKGFSLLLQPGMTLRRISESSRDPLLIRAVCSHLGIQKLRDNGDLSLNL